MDKKKLLCFHGDDTQVTDTPAPPAGTNCHLPCTDCCTGHRRRHCHICDACSRGSVRPGPDQPIILHVCRSEPEFRGGPPPPRGGAEGGAPGGGEEGESSGGSGGRGRDIGGRLSEQHDRYGCSQCAAPYWLWRELFLD